VIVNFSNWILKHKYLVIFGMLGFCLAVGYGASKVRFANDYRIFFSDDNPWLVAFEELENVYTKSDTLMIIISPDNEKVFSKEGIEAVLDTTDEVWQLPYVLRTDSVSNFQHTTVDEDDLLVEDLVREQDTQQPGRLATLENVALKEPLLAKRLIAADGRVTAVVATVHFKGDDKTTELPELIHAARNLITELEQRHPQVEFRLSGNLTMNYAFTEASMIDATTLIPITFLVIFMGLWLFYRGFIPMVASLLVIVGSIVFAMGVLGWMGIAGSPPVMNSPVMIMTLAVADCLHVSTTFFHELRNGKSKAEAITESLRINFQPIFLTSLTTVIGFLSLNFSDAPPFRDLGNVVAIGVAMAFVLSVTLLPALLMALPMPTPKGRSIESRLMERFGEWVVSNHKRLFYGTGILMIMIISLLPRNQLDDIWLDYFDEELPAHQNVTYTRENLTGINTLQYSLSAGESNGINNIEYLTHVENFANWFKAQPEVIHVNSYTTTLKQLNQNLNQDNPEYYRLPHSREAAAQYNLLYELSLPQGLDLNNQINQDKSAMRMVITLKQLSTQELLTFEAKATNWLKANSPKTMHSEGSSSDIMFAHIGMSNVYSMLGGTSIALVLISVVLIIALRSLKYGALSLIPNIAPAAMGYGIWALLEARIGLGLSVVAGMTLGIVVDDTVHFLSKYLRARREKGYDAEQAVKYAFQTVGVALTLTTVVLCLGFTVLMFSAFEMNADNGLLTAITISMALVVDFLFLPGLLILFDRKKSKRFIQKNSPTTVNS
jgi:uncharacterized protein